MSDRDDFRRDLMRETVLAEDVKRRDTTPALGSPCLLARTTAVSAYPTAANRYFACQPQTLLGVESEGGSGVLSASPSVYFALNLGTTVPPAGTLLLTTFVGNRWVFRYDS